LRHRSLMNLCLTLSSISLFFTDSAGAQQQPSPYTPPPNPTSGGNLITALGRSSYEFWLTCIICTVGIAIIGLLIYSITRHTESKPEDISRPVIVVTVIISTLILVTAGYSNEQIAPAFGLFGTIIGYILGRLSSPSSSSSTPAPTPTTDGPP
jgi:hypothetical protein